VINGFLAPPLQIVIMLVANNKKVMGTRTNGLVMNLLGWITAVLMSAAVVALVMTWGK
jgi:Mn2+/Fe2+ NRAMP family transporter